TGFILASFLAIVKDRPWLAWSLFGVAICFKLMAVFFLPFLIYWYFRDWKGWKRFSNLAPLSSVATIIILSILSVLAGNAPFGRIVDLYAVWSTYKSHFHTFLVGGPVASLWNFYNDINLKYLAIGLAVVLVLAAMLYVWKFVRFKQSSLKTGIDWQLLILFTTIVLPYTLPYMLDRYLFLAGMMSFVICLINPRREFYIIFAVLMYVTFWSWDIFVWSDAIFSSGDDFMLFNVVVSTILIGGLLIYLGHLISKNRTIPKKESAK
ncbi:MAG: hypothetical protein LBU20_00190, partial [Candidatus Nomurabacteria bacterium]|nr:hypothetical protein [Candidatus Nomurabacteria bacterium]